MFKRTAWRQFAAVAILAATVILFVNYFSRHPEVRHKLAEIDPSVLALLLSIYVVFVGSLALINIASLKLCRSSISMGESLLLSAYSSVINFFGPLQSGPAFRALYLNQKHGIKIVDYTFASFMYYFFYALFSGLLLLSGLLKWWLLPVIIVLLLAMATLKNVRPGKLKALNRLALNQWPYMAAATLLQVTLLALIFYIELKTIAPGITISQALIYTGAANFALFVSLTPGAIGFRESFLLFTQRLHDINANVIVAANTIDRSVYVLLLAILAVFLALTHARRRLNVKFPAK